MVFLLYTNQVLTAEPERSYSLNLLINLTMLVREREKEKALYLTIKSILGRRKDKICSQRVRIQQF